jgi:predicted AAA+ superfamily ATPase
VARPHSDIREGRLDESVFAANMWAVRQNNAPTTYLDPEQIFAKTYLTGGLSKVLKKAGQALGGTTAALAVSNQRPTANKLTLTKFPERVRPRS